MAKKKLAEKPEVVNSAPEPELDQVIGETPPENDPMAVKADNGLDPMAAEAPPSDTNLKDEAPYEDPGPCEVRVFHETTKEIIHIARVAHEANKGWCEANGDFSKKPWAGGAEPWQQESMINGVKHRLNNPDSPPEHSHNSWLREKEEAGWVYGEVKDTPTSYEPSPASLPSLLSPDGGASG